ncbi:copper transport protein ATX1 [Vigna radiata var. radiata]|uniref:Copper transport protein ATX1 n=1 Tax=Vigna radiata var. radiata TaxID=3916 RepID=A0A1S3UY77_VIGRR|nr:copper transport protein ATX1 [Vigna radiata var. radiata]
MSQTVVLKVDMSCQGCVGAVKRVLGKLDGVESYDIDLNEKKVVVKGNVQPDTVLQTVSKTGKKTTFWEGEAPASETSTVTAA